MTEAQLTELKTDFARVLLKNNDPYAAAFAVFPSEEVSLASEASRRWPLDRFVISEMERLKKEGCGIDNVDKERQAFDVYQIAADKTVDVEFRLKAHDLYAKIRGHIERPAVNNGIINQSNKVMIVRMPTHNDGSEYSEEEWEEQSSLAQKTLQGT